MQKAEWCFTEKQWSTGFVRKVWQTYKLPEESPALNIY